MSNLHYFWVSLLFFFSFQQAVQSQARLQIIHNSPDQTIPTVDVWANGTTQLANNLSFRDATAYLSVPAGNYVVTINPSTSTDSSGALFTSAPLNLLDGESYIAFAEGTLSSGYTPTKPLNLRLSTGRLDAATSGQLSTVVHHGATDAPTLDLYEIGQNNSLVVAADISFGENTGYFDLAPQSYSIQVRTQLGVVAGQYNVDLAPFADESYVLFASGFLDPAANNNGPGFALVGVDTLGNPISFPFETVTPAKVQFIHASAAPAASSLDLWVNNAPLPFVDNLNFRSATTFIDAPAGRFFDLSVAPASSVDTTSAFYKNDFLLESRKEYVVILRGTTGGSFSPAQAFTADYKETSSIPATILSDIRFFNAVTDAPPIDIQETSQLNSEIVSNLSYGVLSSDINLPDENYIFEVEASFTGNTLGRFQVPFATLSSQSITIVACGFLNPANNENGAPFGLWYATSNGGPLIELPPLTSTATASPLSQNMQLFPNPAKDRMTLQFEAERSNNIQLSIINAVGQVVQERVLNAQMGQQVQQLDLSALPAGSYFLQLSDGEGRSVQAFTVQ